MSDIDLVSFLVEWWWLLLFVMRPGLINLTGGYFAGIYLAHTKPDVAREILDTIKNFVGAIQS